MTRMGAVLRDVVNSFLRARSERRRDHDEIRRILLLYLKQNEFSHARDALREMREPPPRELCDSDAVFQSVTAQWRAIHGVSAGDQHADNR